MTADLSQIRFSVHTNGAGVDADETYLAGHLTIAEALNYIDERWPGEWADVGSSGEDDDSWTSIGKFLCPAGCTEHNDDGHPFVFIAQEGF
jgi:hypothetical protein